MGTKSGVFRARGQLTFPAELRRSMRIEEGTAVTFEQDGEDVVRIVTLRPPPAPPASRKATMKLGPPTKAQLAARKKFLAKLKPIPEALLNAPAVKGKGVALGGREMRDVIRRGRT